MCECGGDDVVDMTSHRRNWYKKGETGIEKRVLVLSSLISLLLQ